MAPSPAEIAPPYIRCMSHAGNWSEENSGKFSEQRFGSTYKGGGVALEGAVVDLRIGTIGINSSALEVACGPPGHGRKIKKFLETITPPLTQPALLVSKVESWMTRVPSSM